MRTSSSTNLQEQLGAELVVGLLQNIPTAELEAAPRDESHPLAKDLQTAVSVAVDAGRKQAMQIVVITLECVLRERANGG